MILSNWKLEAEKLSETGVLSWRKISKVLGVPKSSVSDHLRKVAGAAPKDIGEYLSVPRYVGEGVKLPFPNTAVRVPSILTTSKSGSGCTHLVIPDTQCKEGVDMSYLAWIGRYIVEKQPDVIVHLGDHADMEALSSYDKGRKSAEGKRVYKDIEAAIMGMDILLRPLQLLQEKQLREYGKVLYKPRMVLTLGNHEHRLVRHVEANPELAGFLSYDNLKYKEMGWDVYDFLEPKVVNGICYCHFMANPMTGKPYGGTAANILKNVGESFTVGHKQTLDVATRFLPASGKQQWGLVIGACYLHDEGYKGYQGNKHFRGLVVKHNVKDGSYNPMFIDLDYLKEKYGN